MVKREKKDNTRCSNSFLGTTETKLERAKKREAIGYRTTFYWVLNLVSDGHTQNRESSATSVWKNVITTNIYLTTLSNFKVTLW